MPRRQPALEVARWHRPATHLWLDHAKINEEDAQWMQDVQWLTIWNVTVPPGFLARLPELWALDIRGGASTDLVSITGCHRLRFLQVNQVRGMTDLNEIAGLTALELLSLYGIPQVRTLPSLQRLMRLKRVELGSMKGLTSISGALAAPALEELSLSRAVALSDNDLDAMANHRTLSAFEWFAEDVPDRVAQPVLARMSHLKKARILHHDAWFEQHNT